MFIKLCYQFGQQGARFQECFYTTKFWLKNLISTYGGGMNFWKGQQTIEILGSDAPRALIILDVVYKKAENFKAGIHYYLSQQQFIIYK